MPLPPPEEHEDSDGYRSANRETREQPPVILPAARARALHVNRRNQFIERHFSQRRPTVNRPN